MSTNKGAAREGSKKYQQEVRLQNERDREKVKKFAKRRFKMIKLPGDKTIPANLFKLEMMKQQNDHKSSGEDALHKKVFESEKNVRLIQSGKGLIETLMDPQKDQSQANSEIGEGLPVFSMETYKKYLQ